ncbi:MAG: glutathione S-transferase C-terminal domain-containing protein [Paracoccaceae bacterium]
MHALFRAILELQGFFTGDRFIREERLMTSVRVFTFSNLFDGLPAGGPFDLKLLAWLNLAGVPYEHAFQDDTRKGPKGKNPWIELDGERIGDTEIIIQKLGQRFGVDIDANLPAADAATAHGWRRTFEEHFHQIFEWELLAHPEGAAFMKDFVRGQMPPILGHAAFMMMQRGMARQLHARGIARHSPDIIAAKGKHDIDALSAFLGDRPFLVANRPVTADAAVFGQLAPMMVWPMRTPVSQYLRGITNVAAYVDRMRSLCFAERASGSAVHPVTAADG